MTAKLRIMRQLLDDLEPYAGVSRDQLDKDRTTRYVVERILTQLVDLAFGINSHIVPVLIGRAPESYADSFILLAAAGVISESLAAEISPSSGLRNVLVHDYAVVDQAKVARSVPLALTGYRQYVKQVASFLIKQEGDRL